MTGIIQEWKETCKPTVVLEALADYHLWFWHGSFGYVGSLKELNILNSSPLLGLMVDGTFKELEQCSGLVPFDVTRNSFYRLSALVIWIYPPYSRFVRGIQLPLTEPKKGYTTWQEAARKGIERAFCVLQSRFYVMARPFPGHSLKKISNIVSASLIMQNNGVSDRMDGNVYAWYNPAKNSLTINEEGTIENKNAETGLSARGNQQIGLAGVGNANVVQNVLNQRNHW